MLVRLDHGVLIAVGCGQRDEAASQAERAGCHAHRYGKGAAGRDHVAKTVRVTYRSFGSAIRKTCHRLAHAA